MKDSSETARGLARERLGWEETAFAALLFRESLPFFQSLIARILWPWRGLFFQSDMTMLERLADSRNPDDFVLGTEFLRNPRHRGGFVRETLGVRPRRHRIKSWARGLFGKRD
jgi:hypothetical protein